MSLRKPRWNSRLLRVDRCRKVVAFVVVMALWYCLSFLIELESYEVLITGMTLVVAVINAVGNGAGHGVSCRSCLVRDCALRVQYPGFLVGLRNASSKVASMILFAWLWKKSGGTLWFWKSRFVMVWMVVGGFKMLWFWFSFWDRSHIKKENKVLTFKRSVKL